MSEVTITKEKLFYRIIRMLLGGVLILYAFAQLVPAEPLEFRLVELGVGGWNVVPWILRIFIGIEMGIGLLLVLNVDPKKRITKVAGFLMVAMVFDLFADMSAELVMRDHGFARPFGLPFVYAVIACVLFYMGVSIVQRKGKSLVLKWKWLHYVLFVSMLPVPFIVYGIFSSELTDATPVYNEPINLELLPDSVLTRMDSSVLEGNKIIAFLTADCDHCRDAGQKMYISEKNYPDFPDTYLFVWATDSGIPYYLDKSHTKFNGLNIEDPDQFFGTLKSGVVPVVMYLQDGVIKKRWTGTDFNYYVLSNLSRGEVVMKEAEEVPD